MEAFIGTDDEDHANYTEFEWAPNGESLDLMLDLPAKDFDVEQRHGERRQRG